MREFLLGAGSVVGIFFGGVALAWLMFAMVYPLADVTGRRMACAIYRHLGTPHDVEFWQCAK